MTRRYFVTVLLSAAILLSGSAFAAQPDGGAAAVGQDRDAEWTAWQAQYAKRGDSLKAHKKAMVQLVKIAGAYPADYEIQWQCSRAFYYFSERYQKQKDDLIRAAKMSKMGLRCGRAAQKADPKGFDGRYWKLTNYVRVVAAESQSRALREAKDIKKKLEKLIADHPDRLEARMMLGGMYRVLPGFPVSFGDAKKSLEMLLAAEKKGNAKTELLIEIAETYVTLGDEGKAKAYYAKATKAPGYPGMDYEEKDAHDYSRRRIKELNGQ